MCYGDGNGRGICQGAELGPMPRTIQELQKQIITEWLPTSGYEYADAPDIEVYTEGDQQSPSYRSEVWLPVVRKQ